MNDAQRQTLIDLLANAVDAKGHSWSPGLLIDLVDGPLAPVIEAFAAVNTRWIPISDDGLHDLDALDPAWLGAPLDIDIPAFEDDPVAMALGFTPAKPGVLLPGTPEHCHDCALKEVDRLRRVLDPVWLGDS